MAIIKVGGSSQLTFVWHKLLHATSKITLSTYRTALSTILKSSGAKDGFWFWGGLASIISMVLLVIGISTTLLFSDLTSKLVTLLIMFVLIFLTHFTIYFVFYRISMYRVESVNKVLPNALSMIAANLRAGMTPFQAVKLAAIPEFEVLGEEFRIATSKSMGLSNFSEYLLAISDRVDSAALHRSLRLFVSSIKSGAHLADLLNTLAQDISERAALKAELMTNMKTNLMFIMFIIIIGTPLLLSISIYFVDTITVIQGKGGSAGGTSSSFGSLGGLGGEIKITSTFLTYVAYVLLFFTGLFASFFIGAVMEGDFKAGLSYAPVIIISSYALFFTIRYIIYQVLVGA